MFTELIPAKLAFRGLSDEDEEDPTVVDAPGDLDDEDEEDEDEALGGTGTPDDDQNDGALEQ